MVLERAVTKPDELTTSMRYALIRAGTLRHGFTGVHLHWSCPSPTVAGLRRRGLVEDRSRRLTEAGLVKRDAVLLLNQAAMKRAMQA